MSYLEGSDVPVVAEEEYDQLSLISDRNHLDLMISTNDDDRDQDHRHHQQDDDHFEPDLCGVLVIIIIIIIIITRPRLAFGWLGLGGSSGGNISHSSLRAYGAQLVGDR